MNRAYLETPEGVIYTILTRFGCTTNLPSWLKARMAQEVLEEFNRRDMLLLIKENKDGQN